MEIEKRIAAIIIAAGYSSRMKSFKPLMRFGQNTALERLIHSYKKAGINDIFVITGHRCEEIIESLREENVDIIINELYSEGMFSSVQKGVKELGEKYDAFFMNPVDIPLVKNMTIEVMKKYYLQNTEGIIYPYFNEKKGHPVLIDCKYNRIILDSDGEGGLKKVLQMYTEDAVLVPVIDQFILMDMDTPEDYDKLIKLDSLCVPTTLECQEILKYYEVSDNIIRHCEAVKKVANNIYTTLEESGIILDKEALMAAASLHDIVRSRKNHAVEGGKILKELGYDFVGEIIASHMQIEVYDDEPINEKEVLFLADKLVLEDKLCSLEERFDQKLKEYENDLKSKEKIIKKYKSSKKIIEKIKKTTGKGFIYV